jgi:hypothetical protein
VIITDSNPSGLYRPELKLFTIVALCSLLTSYKAWASADVTFLKMEERNGAWSLGAMARVQTTPYVGQ